MFVFFNDTATTEIYTYLTHSFPTRRSSDLVHAQNADVSGMMMTAGVDAAGNLELQFTQIPLTLGVGETLADLLRHRNRPRIDKAAIIKTGAGDDVADKVKIGRREPSRIQLLPERVEIALLHIGQDDILAVRDAHLIKRILLCQIGNKVDLIGRSITRNAAHGLQADRGDGIAGDRKSTRLNSSH